MALDIPHAPTPASTQESARPGAPRIDEALAFDDVLLVPGYSQVLPVRRPTPAPASPARISLNIPLISAAMDTVTEGDMAIAMAQHGGIGVIHKNLDAERAGRPGPPREEVRIRHGGEPAHHPPRPDARRRARR